MINKILFDKYDGTEVSKEDQASIKLNFPMWFDTLENEINDNDVTVCVYIDQIGVNHIHLENASHELNLKLARRFPLFAHNPSK